MILFFDEDCGRAVPEALARVGIRVDYVGKKSKGKGVRLGAKDPDWIQRAGKLRHLVFSCNQSILSNEAERKLVIDHKVGIVFLSTGQEQKIDFLRLILNNLDWLEWIDENMPKPFAFRITITGVKTVLLGDEEKAKEYRKRKRRKK